MNTAQSTPEVQQLATVLTSCTNQQEMLAFLEDVCTPREIHEISMRLQVALLLNQGVSYTYIQEQLGVSATTISRVSRALNYGPGGYARAIQLLNDCSPDDE